jgi:hypothetical protein
MPTATGRRQNSSVKPKVAARQKGSQEEQKMADSDQSAGKLIAFTIDANTAQIVKLESLDATGARHELSDEEKASFVHEGAGKLEDVLEQAFEAGIDCVLGDGARDEAEESQEDAKLRHLLLTPLLEHSAARRLLQPEVLHRAILETLVQHSMKPIPGSSQGSAPVAQEAERATPSRAN